MGVSDIEEEETGSRATVGHSLARVQFLSSLTMTLESGSKSHNGFPMRNTPTHSKELSDGVLYLTNTDVTP